MPITLLMGNDIVHIVKIVHIVIMLQSLNTGLGIHNKPIYTCSMNNANILLNNILNL